MQTGEPAFWLYMVLLVLGGLLFGLIQLGMALIGGAFALSWVLVLLYALPVAAVIYMLDLFEREPKPMILAAIVWGAVIAVPFAALADSSWIGVLGKVAPRVALDWAPAIVAPPVEETLKLLGVVTLYLIAREEFDGPLDGFIYGAMVGLGFTVVEDVLYFMAAAGGAASPADQAGPVFEIFFIRVLAGGLYGHVLYTGLAGIGFAYLMTRRGQRLPKRFAVCAFGVAAALLGHWFWNSPLLQEVVDLGSGAKPSPLQWIEYGALKGGPFLVLLVILVVMATRSEEATFRSVIAGEPAPDVITEQEIRSLRSLIARRRARFRALRSGGRGAARLVARLQRAQIEYAMARSRTESLEDPAVEAQRAKIRAIRRQLAAIASGLRPAPDLLDWSPSNVVTATGAPAWDRPDPFRAPVATLPAGLPVVIEWHSGAWVRVRTENGWRGWVDVRSLAGLA